MANEQQYQGLMQKVQERSPTFSQIVELVTLLTVGGVLLTMSGLTLTGTVIALAVMTPVLILFSPILVPAGIMLFLTVAGFLAAGGMGVAAISFLSWIFNYMRGDHPPGAEQLDYARRRVAETTGQMGHKARDYAGAVQGKAQEATRT